MIVEGGTFPRYTNPVSTRGYPNAATEVKSYSNLTESPVVVPAARVVIFLLFSAKFPEGAVIVAKVLVFASAFVSAYPFVLKSVLRVGVASVVIFCEFKLTLAVGAVILLRVVVFK